MTGLMKNETISRSRDRYLLFLVSFLLVFHILCNLCIRSISFAVDEFIPLGIAADLAGLDWNHARAYDYYYGYITLLFYIPLFKIPAIYQNSYLLTQGILGINSVFHVILSVLLYKTLCLLHPETEKRKINCAITLFSVCILQVFNVSLGAQIESMFYLCFMVVFYLIVRISVGRAHLYEAVLIAVFSWAAYANNTRGLVLLIASALVLALVSVADKKKTAMLLLFLSVTIVLILLHKYVILPEYMTYFESEANNTSSASFISKMKSVFTDVEYLKTFFSAFLGWMWACVANTFGIFLIAGGATLFQLCHLIKRKDYISAAIPGFVLLIFTGSLCLSLINSVNTAYLLLQSGSGDRADVLFYVRYVSCALSVITAYGLEIWIDVKKDKKKFYAILFAGEVLLGAWFFVFILKKMDGFQYAMNNTVFIAMFLKGFQINFRYGTVYAGNGMILVVFTLFLFAAIILASILYGKKIVLYVLASLQIVFCAVFVNTIAYGRSEYYAEMIDSEIIDYCNSSVAETIYINNSTIVGQYQIPDKVVCCDYEDQDILILLTAQSFNVQMKEYELVIRTEDWLVYEKKELVSLEG